jgi:hypothetical protein
MGKGYLKLGLVWLGGLGNETAWNRTLGVRRKDLWKFYWESRFA